jgi:hypothetical protein
MTENVLSRRRWVPWSCEVGDATLTCELKRMNALEAADFKGNLAAAFGTVRDSTNIQLELFALRLQGPGDTAESKALFEQAAGHLIFRLEKVYAAFFQALDRQLVERVFSTCIRNVTGLVMDDESIVTGAQLLDVADEELLRGVLMQLRLLTELSATEGKASSSPSTSGSEASEPPSTVFPAPSIEPEASTAPSTVPENLAESA